MREPVRYYNNSKGHCEQQTHRQRIRNSEMNLQIMQSGQFMKQKITAFH